MQIVKTMRRRDAWSVTLAVVIGFMLSSPLAQSVGPLTGKIVGDHNGPYSYGNLGWKDTYFAPWVYFVLQLVALEILLWVCLLLGWAARRLMPAIAKK